MCLLVPRYQYPSGKVCPSAQVVCVLSGKRHHENVIDWFEIPVSDVPRAQAFYEAVLKTTLQRENCAGPGMQMAVFVGEGDATKGALRLCHPALQVGACSTLVYLHAGASLDAASAIDQAAKAASMSLAIFSGASCGA